MSALYLDIVNDIKEKINNEEFEKGDKLPSERMLALEYEVSRNVVREAISTLRNEGFVHVQPGRGTYITNPKLTMVSDTIERVMKNYNVSLTDIINVREGLESSVIKNMIQRVTQEEINTLYSIYNEMEKYKINVEEYVKLDEKFHLYLAKYTKNPLYEILIHSFIEMTQSVLFEFTRLAPESIAKAQEHHLELIKLIEQRDEESALKLLKAHMQVLRNEIEILKERKLVN